MQLGASQDQGTQADLTFAPTGMIYKPEPEQMKYKTSPGFIPLIFKTELNIPWTSDPVMMQSYLQ